MRTITNTTQNILLGAATGAALSSLIMFAGYAVANQLYGASSENPKRDIGKLLRFSIKYGAVYGALWTIGALAISRTSTACTNIAQRYSSQANSPGAFTQRIPYNNSVGTLDVRPAP